MPRKPLFKVRLGEWIEDCERRMLSTATVEGYETFLGIAFRFAKEHDWPMNPKKITSFHIKEYYEYVSNLSMGTQKQYMDSLLRFLKWAGNKNFEDVNLRIQQSRSRVNWLSEEQVGLLVSEARSPNLKAMVTLLAYTGMRSGELRTLRAKDVKRDEVVVRGKGRKERSIPVDDEFWIEIDPYIKERERIGPHETFLVHRSARSGMRVSSYSDVGIYNAVIKHGLRFNLHTPPHTFRRSFGRHLYKRNCPLAELKTLMGHASIEQTISYLGIGECDLEDAMKFRPSYREISRLKREGITAPSSFVPGGG